MKQLEHPDEDCHRNAAGALKNLSYGKYLDDNKVRFINIVLWYPNTSILTTVIDICSLCSTVVEVSRGN